MSTTWWLALLTALVASPAWAFHTVFSYRVDRIELDGNVAGPYDGVSDVVDDFSDGSLSPNFYNPYGTATESGGFLVLQSPGAHFPMPGGGLTDVTIAASTGSLVVYKGSGSFTAKATWEQNLPPVGHHYHFSLFTYGGPVSLYNEIFGIAVTRGTTSLSLEQHLTEIDQIAGVYRNTMLDYFDIDDADVTGDIVIRLSVDDAISSAQAQISLDGGTTWIAPFSPAPIFQGRTIGQFLLSADPIIDGAPPPPPTTTTTTTSTSSTTTSTTIPIDACAASTCRRGAPESGRLQLRNGDGDKRDAIKWRFDGGAPTAPADFGDPTAGTTYTVCVKSGATSQTHAAGASTAKCGKPPCWKKTARGWRFKGTKGLAVQKLQLDVRNANEARIGLSSAGPGTVLPAMPAVIPVEVVLRASTGACWVSTFGPTGVDMNTAQSFRAKSTN
jgi:hypothetical protein